MEIVLHLKTLVDAAFSVNGVFLENNKSVRYRCNEAVYVTVLPLSAALLPYTTKFVGCDATTNHELVSVININSEKFIAVFDKRYNYVFAPGHHEPYYVGERGCVNSFFESVKSESFDKARSFLTHELSQSVDDGALSAFFADFRAILKNEEFVPAAKNSYFLVDNGGKAHLYSFSLKNNLIDNIISHDE